MRNRILILFCAFLGLWGLLILRAARLQIFPDVRLENLKRRQFETSLEIRTRRGAITDRNGNELAASIPSYSLFADPKLIHNTADLARRLSKALNIPANSLRKRMHDHQRRFVWIKRQLSSKQRADIEQWGEQGLGFIEEPKRVYPNGSLLSQVLGFVGAEGNGLEGLELQYDKILRGQLKTVLLPRDARGRVLLSDARALIEVPDGADIELTIDHEIQFTLERELQNAVEKFQASSAVGIVVDAQSSEIQAMATVPTVDLNDGLRFSPEIRRNRVVTDAFEPGSVMKTFVIAGALKDGVVKPSTRYWCENGRMKVGDKWIKEAMSSETFGWLDVTEILAKSSNVGAAKIGFDLGDERLARTLNDFGFGQKTGVELPGEARGILNPLPWRPHLLSNIAFGHGISVSPLQVAAAYTAIANGGVLKRPLLVKAIHSHDAQPQEFQAEEVHRILTPSQAATMRLMLMAATEPAGTGINARIPGYYVAGKTGTAQKVDTANGGYIKNAYVSSFAGFVPANNPRYVIYVAVDDPRKAYYGTEVAAPVFARMAQYLVRRAGLPPEQITEHNVIAANSEQQRSKLQTRALLDLKRGDEAANPASGFPNLLGLTLREALVRVHAEASQVDVRGYGVVVRTVPSAGAQLAPKSRVTLVLENPD